MTKTTQKEERHPRLVRVGDLIQSKQDRSVAGRQVVRGVDIVVHLANGTSEVYTSEERVNVLPEENMPSLEELAEVLNSEADARARMARISEVLKEAAES